MPKQRRTITSTRAALVGSLIALVGLPTAPSYGACGGNVPASTVPQCRPEAGVDCSIWPVDPGTGLVRFWPASSIPSSRDSTGWTTTKRPNWESGYEFFRDIAFPGNRDGSAAVASDYAYVAYTNGLQVWDLADVPQNPVRLAVRDLWIPGDWFVPVGDGEVDEYLYAIDAIEAEGSNVLLAMAGAEGVGISFWRFDTGSETLTQFYQQTGEGGLEIRLVAFGGRFYAFAATSRGLAVYDVTAARNRGACISNSSGVDPACPDVFLGYLGGIARASALDVLVRDDEIFVVVVDQSTLGVQIWRLTDPAQPEVFPTGTAELYFSGLHPASFAPRLFDYRGQTYLAAVESKTVQGQGRTMSVYDASPCLDGPCATLGTRHAFEQLTVTNSSTSFLTLTWRDDGTPYLYFGFSGPFVDGTGHERLWSLAGLPRVFADNTLPEVTDGGDTYTDPCNATVGVDYFADYYHGNAYGLHRFSPRHGRFQGDYFYRTARSIFDVHRIRGAAQTGGAQVDTQRVSVGEGVVGDQFAFGDDIDFTAQVSECTAAATAWCWTTSHATADVTTTPSAQCSAVYGQDHTIRFTCDRSSRCEDTVVTVSAWNSACGTADAGAEIATTILLVDPRIFADGFESGTLELWSGVQN